MAIISNTNGTIIGLIFTLLSWVLTWTFIVPIVSVMPGLFILDSIFSFQDTNGGQESLNSLLIILGVFLSFVLVRTRMVVFNNYHISFIMVIAYFIFHTLGFYVYWQSLGYRGDGQLIFGAVKSFPYSSFGFLFFGILIDLVKIKQLKTNSN